MRLKRDMSYDEAYRIVVDNNFYGSGEGVIDGDEEYRALAKLVTACERQISMPPVVRDVNGKKVKCCFDCGVPIEVESEYGLKRCDFCPKCGKKIAWLRPQDSIVKMTCDTFRRKMSPTIKVLSKITNIVIKTMYDTMTPEKAINEIKTTMEQSGDSIFTNGQLEIMVNEVADEIAAQLDDERGAEND